MIALTAVVVSSTHVPKICLGVLIGNFVALLAYNSPSESVVGLRHYTGIFEIFYLHLFLVQPCSWVSISAIEKELPYSFDCSSRNLSSPRTLVYWLLSFHFCSTGYHLPT